MIILFESLWDNRGGEMKGGKKYFQKGQVLVFFLVFIALFGLVIITVGIDIFRVSQTKIMLQTAVDGRALHIMSLYAKQLNFLADMNRQMIGTGIYGDATDYITRPIGDPNEIWIGFDTVRCPWRDYITHTEGNPALSCPSFPDGPDFVCAYPANYTIGYAIVNTSGSSYYDTSRDAYVACDGGDPYKEVNSPVIWYEPPPVSEFDTTGDPDRAFPTEGRAEEYRDDFITPRVDLQNKALEEVGIGFGNPLERGLLEGLVDSPIEMGVDKDGNVVELKKSIIDPLIDGKLEIDLKDNFENYAYSYWTSHREEIDLPYIEWGQHTQSWTHSYTSGTMTQTCTVYREWWEPTTNTINDVPAWLELADGDILSGRVEVKGKKDIRYIKFGSSEDIKDVSSEAIVELDTTTGRIWAEGSAWPDPEPSYQIKFSAP